MILFCRATLWGLALGMFLGSIFVREGLVFAGMEENEILKCAGMASLNRLTTRYGSERSILGIGPASHQDSMIMITWMLP